MLDTRLRLLAFCAALAIAAPAGAGPVQDTASASFESAGMTLYYRTAGSGPPVILLSGGPGFDVDYMIPAAEFLPAGYTRVFLEQRGTGRSQPTRPTAETMTLRLVVQDLEALRIQLRQERVILLGHSWGGMLAMAYAAAHPDRVDRLILVSSGGPTLEFDAWFGDNIRARLRPEDADAAQYWNAAEKRGVDADKVALERIRAIAPGYFFDRAKGLAFAGQLTDGSLHSQVNQLLFNDLGRSYDLRQGLRTLTRPVLIVHGHQDPIGDKTAEDIHALIGGSTLTYLKQCGHFPWLEQPDAFRKALAGFLSPAPSR